MAFVGTTNLTALLNAVPDTISPLDLGRIKNGAYELSLGGQVFLTDSSPRCIKNLTADEQIEIKPGQFALLLTKEYVKIPNDRIAFISIKAGIKFKGLVNVSGFHVDPGFEGKLLFSVYNAGPSNIVMSEGSAYFPIWFAELDQAQGYSGSHGKQSRIPNEPVEALSQGELASPNVLSKRIEENKHLKTKIEWIFLAIFTAVVGILVKVWLDEAKLKEAITYGYQKKATEIVADSTITALKDSISQLNKKIETFNGPKKDNHAVNKK